MPRGKHTGLTISVYKALRAEGLNRQQIAEKLNLNPTSVSKFTMRHKKELEAEGVNVSYSGKPPAAEMSSDTIDQLLKMNLALTDQIKKIVKDLKGAGPKEAIKLTEVLIKCLSEARQQHLALENVKSALNDQKTIFQFFQGVVDAISAEVPKDARLKIFNRILALRNAFAETPEIQAATKAGE